MHSPPGCIINEQKREVNRSSKTPCLKVYIYQTLLGMLKGENEAMLYVFRPIHSEYLYMYIKLTLFEIYQLIYMKLALSLRKI